MLPIKNMSINFDYFFHLKGIPPEVWRYYLLAIRPEQSDSMFTWKDFQDKLNNELLKNIGNFVNRSLMFTNSTFGGLVPPIGVLGDLEKKLIDDVNALLKEYINQMDEVKLKASLKTVMVISSMGNGYLTESQPWVLAKSDMSACGTSIALCVGLVHLLATIMEPFMPGFSEKLYHQLNVDAYDIPNSWSGASIAAGHKINETIVPLFKALSDDEVNKFRAQYGSGDLEEKKEEGKDKKKGGKVSICEYIYIPPFDSELIKFVTKLGGF
jgi:methionyl-tRNA synthetase